MLQRVQCKVNVVVSKTIWPDAAKGVDADFEPRRSRFRVAVTPLMATFRVFTGQAPVLAIWERFPLHDS